MEDYSKLIAECLAEMEAVPPMTAAERAHMERWFAYLDACYEKEHPTPCRKDKNCIRAGGCYYRRLLLLFGDSARMPGD
ncbi:MAG: hypothetical protein DMG76_26280 [Acidobacteria bacterium]|nr:MAG: hypothetical protein DMG76_26280 [Acidobacteriota bacterium]